MDFETINTAFAVMALLANLITLAFVIGFVLTRFSVARRESWHRLRQETSPLLAALAWVVGVFCTCASLYLQFGEHLTPCDLCWFQRICMYPQALVLGVALLINDRHAVRRYMIPLAGIGALISITHIFLADIINWLHLSQVPGCSLDAPCTFQPIQVFGWETIPYMAMSGFLLIVTLLACVREEPER